MKHTLFSTYVHQAEIQPPGNKGRLQSLNKELKHEIQVLQKEDLVGQAWSKENYRHGYTSYGSLDRLFDFSPTFMELQGAITKEVKKYLKTMGAQASHRDLFMSSMWVNVMPPGSYHTMHIHPFSVVSGTYYLEVSPTTSPLKIEDPRMGFLMNAPQMRALAKPEQQRFFEVHPKVGEVVLFESWLRHEVPENRSKSPRVSISFNYDWLK